MIVCCGEALIDMIPIALDDGRRAYVPTPGGAIFNTAIALGRLGQPTGFVSGVSSDLFGRQLVDTLEQSKVDTQLLHRNDCPTTLAFVELTDGQAKYTFYDEGSATRQLDIADLPVFDDSVEALQFGAISLIGEPCGSAYEHLMGSVANNAVIALDPNIRPLFITEADSYRARLNRMLALSDIIKVSDEDLEWLAPGQPWPDFCRQQLSDGAAVIIRTRGADGCDAVTENLSITVPAAPATVVDTIGAGDTFNAGLLAALRSLGLLSKDNIKRLDQNSLEKAVGYAAEVAAVTVSRAGANPPWASELAAPAPT